MTERADGTHLWLVLMKAHRALARHAERSIAALDMCLSDFAILELLLHKGPQKLTDLGRRIDLSSGAMTTAVDRLEARQLVARSFDTADRRTRVVHLTPAGESLIAAAFGEHADAMNAAAGGLDADEQTRLTALLKKLGTHAERQLT
jgi:MarR family 2-MHQ and catechol resistance regulon transcriptional repressor